MRSLYLFVMVMWALVIAGGGIAVVVLGPLQVTGLGEHDRTASSVLQAAAALLMVAAWIVILARIKDYAFRREMRWD